MNSKITLVDDDRNILTSVSMALEDEGYTVETFNNGEDGLNGILSGNPDLVVLDVKMPRMDGMELLEKLRKHSRVPVIFLTSKDDEIDEVLGLRMGADDYITKPFSQRLLIERIRVLLRRQALLKDETNSNPERGEPQKTGKRLVLDDKKHICTWDGTRVDLTVTEYLLVKELSKNPGEVKTRDQLIEAAYGGDVYVDDRTIDSHIKRVRKKFKKVAEDFNHIETLYGIGYRYKE